jgi:hypothetical protein
MPFSDFTTDYSKLPMYLPDLLPYFAELLLYSLAVKQQLPY